MERNEEQTRSWPELAIGLYDQLTGRGAEITYSFCDFEVMVPSTADDATVHAPWKVNGALSIRTKDHR